MSNIHPSLETLRNDFPIGIMELSPSVMALMRSFTLVSRTIVSISEPALLVEHDTGAISDESVKVLNYFGFAAGSDRSSIVDPIPQRVLLETRDIVMRRAQSLVLCEMYRHNEGRYRPERYVRWCITGVGIATAIVVLAHRFEDRWILADGSELPGRGDDVDGSKLEECLSRFVDLEADPFVALTRMMAGV